MNVEWGYDEIYHGSYLTIFFIFFWTVTCALIVSGVIWYYVYNLKNVKNTHEGVLILVKFAAHHNCEWSE